MVTTADVLSMIVNALVTGLVVFRIFRVFRGVKGTYSSNEQTLGATGDRKLRSIIFILIESGMALFAIQLAWLTVSFILLKHTGVEGGYLLILPIHQMLHVIVISVIAISYFTDHLGDRG